MMIDEVQSNSQSWLFFVKASFAISLIAMAIGIFIIPVDMTVKGYLAICALFIVSSTITMSKTLRDDHESQRLINKLSEAKTQQIIKEYSDA
ncbi:YiaA/YiaB family inner membrane protein [Alkalimarinus sediminis]|uniref:YiaA/YiaB family inner membrane protein n=1 Tax=Alkalimarinus sediminis TaxID=1632866 RepID=A0A9E8HH66_9ALTE|nr:YiaA/YiaB family inner membrane protein [Alkalimarinus sediminis]UZW74349.1 YiaA/YiaB family inner membrane protein [Alkalimarinus sediminis]